MSLSSREIAARVGLVVGSLLLTALLVEGVFRFLAPDSQRADGSFDPNNPLLRVLKPSECKPDGKLDGSYYVEVCTNKLGLRDRDHEPEDLRVLGLGDSFTFGWGVEHEDTFLSVFERGLRLPGGRKTVGVHNAGISYTSQVHQDMLARHIWKDIEPQVVVLGFAEDNDIDENIMWNPQLGVFPYLGEVDGSQGRQFETRLNGMMRADAWYRNFATVRFFRHRTLRTSVRDEMRALQQRLQAQGLEEVDLDKMARTEGERRFLQAYSDKHNGDWEVTRIVLDRVRNLVEDNGARLVLLRVPSRVTVDDDAWQRTRKQYCGETLERVQASCGTLDREHTGTRLAAWAREHDLTYIDPAPALKEARERGERLYHRRDIHLNRLGHRRVGEVLTANLAPELVEDRTKRVSKLRRTKPGERHVGAYWYPWYRSTLFDSITDFTPAHGGYISNERSTILRQIHWAERAEIDFLFVETLPDHNREAAFNNSAIELMIQTLAERRKKGLGNLQFAILSDVFVGETEVGTNERWQVLSKQHLDQIQERYVEPYRDAYFHLEGKPLVGVFSPPVPIEDERYTLVLPYWVSKPQWEKWDRRDELFPFWDTYPQVMTDERFVTVTPGYNDWRLRRDPQVAPYMSRQSGRTYVDQWKRAYEVDPSVVLVYSFNEYLEQTQIEPSKEFGSLYLQLNQELARTWKDATTLDASFPDRYWATLDPPEADTERARWLAIDDPALKSEGLTGIELTSEATLTFERPPGSAFVVAVGHAPTFHRCTAIYVAVGDTKGKRFGTELRQQAIMRDVTLNPGGEPVTVKLKLGPMNKGCAQAPLRPVEITGLALYQLPTEKRLRCAINEPRVQLEEFWPTEEHPEGAFAWSKALSTVTVSELPPGATYDVMLEFRDTANFGNVEIGSSPEALAQVVLTPGRTAASAQALTTDDQGRLSIVIKTDTWSPSRFFEGNTDDRELGLALKSIVLDATMSGKGSNQGSDQDSGTSTD